ncbi:SDR family oxidoreductase [Erythrobacter sp. AP23]|uniref:SDR family oxidoreductase n=1 Tax=Erythrobacter sp. AP23 TaxID=499656 RepID=UPI00076D5A57|nr:SDR family oxidoreductase [Erythrobacter sp. AP23]KWV93779.1 serine/threonine protein kinase [Erythrobacter sp. AP23]
MDELHFDGKAVIVTGAGTGLGRAHALEFARRGAKVLVNDLGTDSTGSGRSSTSADEVVDTIRAAGGIAEADYHSVEHGEAIVGRALDHFQRVDVLVNNAGILRDRSFKKQTDDEWDLVYRVHLLGAARVTKAAWPHMMAQGNGRVIFTSSAAGIYGNFGQANYSAAKLGVLGLANTLAVEGQSKNILVNTIAPVAASRMLATVLPDEVTSVLDPTLISPLVAYLCHDTSNETGGLFEVGGGWIAKLRWQRSQGADIGRNGEMTAEGVAASWDEIVAFDRAEFPSAIQDTFEKLEQITSHPFDWVN